MVWFSKGKRWMPSAGDAGGRRFSWRPLHTALLFSLGMHALLLAQTWPQRENANSPRLSAIFQVRLIAEPSSAVASVVTAPDRGWDPPVMTAERAPSPVTPAVAAQEMLPVPTEQAPSAPTEPPPSAEAPPVLASPPGISISTWSGWDYPGRRRAFAVPNARAVMQEAQSQAFGHAQHLRMQEMAVQAARWLLADLQQHFSDGQDLICEISASGQCQPDQQELATFIQQRWGLLRGVNPGLQAIRVGRVGGSWQFMGF